MAVLAGEEEEWPHSIDLDDEGEISEQQRFFILLILIIY
jgi:hypothetical protein